VLKSIGIDEKRINMSFCTAAEGQKFQNSAIEFDKIIKELGPSPLRAKTDTPKKKKVKDKAKA
jgi:coenzyme F420-reducing hydrogenase delta subunit